MTVNRSFTSPIIWQLCSLFFVGSNNVAFDDSGWNSFGGDASHRAYLNTSILNQFFYIPLQWTQSLDITSGLELHYATISSGYVWLTSPCCIYKIHPRHGELQTFDLHQIDQTASWTWDSAIGPAIGFNDKIIIQTRQCRPTQDDSSWCASVTLWTAAYASDNVTLLWNVEVNTKASYYDYPYGVTPSVGHNLIYYGGGLHNRNMFAVDATSGIIQYTASVETDTGTDSWALIRGQNAKIFQYATILSFVFIDAVFYLCVVLMLSSCSGCGIMYMQQCISCCCSCSPEHCPHCRDHKCYPCANRSCTNECDCLCFCICVPIMPQCCWIGLGLGVIAFLVVLVVVTLVIVSIIGMIPLFIIICIVSIPLVCVRHNMQCKAYCIDMMVMFERVLRINTVEVEQKKFTLSFGEYIERNDDEYITQTMTNVDEESEYWFESGFEEFEAIELVTKPQITQKIEKCEMEKGYLCFDISHHKFEDGFELCDACQTNQTNYPQHHRAFIRRQREFMIQQSNRNQMNWLRRLNIFIPILSPLLLILFIATNQVIVAHTLMFWDQQFNWYNTWYFWTDFWVGFGDTFMNWLLLLSNKELLMEFLHDLIYFSFTWKSFLTFLDLFDEFRFSVLFFKAVFQTVLFILYKIDHLIN
eukprot:878548_1